MNYQFWVHNPCKYDMAKIKNIIYFFKTTNYMSKLREKQKKKKKRERFSKLNYYISYWKKRTYWKSLIMVFWNSQL